MEKSKKLSDKNLEKITYPCKHCDETFTSKQRRAQHWDKKVNCRNECHECGIFLNSKSSFKKHLDTNCEYIPKNVKNIQHLLPEKSKIKLEKEPKKEIPIEKQSINSLLKLLKEQGKEIEIVRAGEETTKLDRNKIFGKMAKTGVKMLVDSIHGKDRWIRSDIANQVVWCTVKQMYLIKSFPETLNTYVVEKTYKKKNKTKTKKIFMVYDGEKFVKDTWDEAGRVLSMFYNAFDIVRWMVKESEHPEDIKELLISRLYTTEKNNYNDYGSFVLQSNFKLLTDHLQDNKGRIKEILRNKLMEK